MYESPSLAGRASGASVAVPTHGGGGGGNSSVPRGASAATTATTGSGTSPAPTMIPMSQLTGIFTRAAAATALSPGGGASPSAGTRSAGGRLSASGQPIMAMSTAPVELAAGASDYLRLAGPAAAAAAGSPHRGAGYPDGTVGGDGNAAAGQLLKPQQVQILRDYLIAQGDRRVHFSGEAIELLSSLPVRRLIIVTENAFYRIPQSTLETGIFFDCRIELVKVCQVISADDSSGLGGSHRGGASSQQASSPLVRHGNNEQPTGAGSGGGLPQAIVEIFEKNPRTDDVNLTVMLSFGDATLGTTSTAATSSMAAFQQSAAAARRKAFLLSLCIVCPTLPVLQKVTITDSTAPTTNSGSAVAGAGGDGRSPSHPHQQQQGGGGGGGKGGPGFMKVTASLAAKMAPRGRALSTTHGGNSPIPVVSESSMGASKGGAGAGAVTTSTSRQLSYRGDSQPSATTTNGVSTTSYPLAPNYYGGASAAAAASGSYDTGNNNTTTGGANNTSNDISEQEFEALRRGLHEALERTGNVPGRGGTEGGWGYGEDGGSTVGGGDDGSGSGNGGRPKEEDMSLMLEREKVKAMILSREAKIVQNIEFRMKYPQKVATKVPPGVEYDKSHEEERVLPDDFTDAELLGPSLFPLWKQWKQSGGLLLPDGTPNDAWNLYDSTDLVDSLRAREEALYGLVGKKSMRRLLSLRELVGRERQMFLNKRRAVLKGGGSSGGPGGNDAASSSRRSGRGTHDDDDDGEGSGGGGHSSYARSPRSAGAGTPSKATVTQPKPFNLSQSPSSTRKGRFLDSAALVQEMKSNFERHLANLHQLRKDQLQRELIRVND